MATVNGSGADNVFGTLVYTWTGVVTGNVGDAKNIGWRKGVPSVQVEGTLGTSPSYNIEGSNDGANWESLKDINGVTLGALTTKGIFSVGSFPLYIRPNVTAGTGGTSLTFTLVVR